MKKRTKKGRLTLHTFYPVVKYMGALLVALSYPRLSDIIWVMPDYSGPRALIMLWVAFLLGISLWMDKSYAKAEKKDLEEIQQQVRYGNMNRSTLLALGVPCLFILDMLAITHLYLAYFHSGTAQASPVSLALHTGAMAAGMVLFIYGSFLPRTPFGSIWGIKTKRSIRSADAWRYAQEGAAPCALGCGALILFLGALFPATAAFACAMLLLAAALAGMFHQANKPQ